MQKWSAALSAGRGSRVTGKDGVYGRDRIEGRGAEHADVEERVLAARADR